MSERREKLGAVEEVVEEEDGERRRYKTVVSRTGA